jgi:hypothetical protein
MVHRTGLELFLYLFGRTTSSEDTNPSLPRLTEGVRENYPDKT